MWMAIGLISFVAFVVLLIMGLVAVFKKTGKAKKFLFPALACFVITIIAAAADPSDTDVAEQKNNSAKTETAVKAENTDSKPATVEQAKEPAKSEEKKTEEKVNGNGLTEKQQQDLYHNSIINETASYIQLKVKGTLSKDRYESAKKLINNFLSNYNGTDKAKLQALADAVNADDLKAAQKQYIALGGEDFEELHKEAAANTTKADQGSTSNPPTITKAEFDKIKNGMSYKQVAEIIGGPGEVLSEAGEEGTEFYTVMYMYEGEGMLGANANFTFQGGKLQAKAQLGLE